MLLHYIGALLICTQWLLRSNIDHALTHNRLIYVALTHLSFKKHISVLKTQCKEALKLIRVVAHLKWGGDRDTLLMLYRAIVRSKFDYGCIVYGTASNTNLRQRDSIHNSGLRLPLGPFCTSPVSSLYTEANEAPLEERRLKLSMPYYVKTRACIDNPAYHALHEFDRTTFCGL